MAPSDQTDFPVLIKITEQSNPVFNSAQSDGDDILFASSDGITKLDHEIEYYKNTSTKELDAWVRIPTLSSSSDTVIYMYYGNSVASNQENATGVWDSNYLMVHHLEESSGMHFDSTSNNYNGTPQGGVTQGATGQIDSADSFNGVDGFIELGSILDFERTDSFTAGGWIYRNTANNAGAIISKYDNSLGRGWALQSNTYPAAENFRVALSNNDGANRLLVNTAVGSYPPAAIWYHVVVTYDGSSDASGVKIYVNGVSQTLTIVQNGLNATIQHSVSVKIGGRGDPATLLLEGSIDEVRASNTERSAEWITTSYNNQNDPGTCLTFNNQESF